jgi:HlyD family secretion protein
MNTPVTRSIIIITIVIAAIAATGWYFKRPKAIEVVLHTIERGNVEATASNTRVGTVNACHRSMLAPTFGGEVSLLTVKEGDKVKKGDLLLEIWNEDLKAQLQLAQAQKITAEAQAQQACKLSEGSKRELDRLQKLLKDKLISEEKVDLQFTDFEGKQAACSAARASIEVSQAQINVAQTTLQRTIVRAPFDGTVAEVNAELGEYVTPSPQGILTLPAIDLLDMSCLYVSAPIDEVDAPPINVGMEACVTLDAFPDRQCDATVRRIAPYVLDREKQARTVEVEVEITDPADMLGMLPGYSADIEIVLDKKADVIRIPSEAILEGDRVLVYQTDSETLMEKKFEKGISNWSYAEVISGLSVGEQIVLSIGREGIEAGAFVTPEETPAE